VRLPPAFKEEKKRSPAGELLSKRISTPLEYGCCVGQ
jgi:hypothetical protein